jgi:hypothetical protein
VTSPKHTKNLLKKQVFCFGCLVIKHLQNVASPAFLAKYLLTDGVVDVHCIYDEKDQDMATVG